MNRVTAGAVLVAVVTALTYLAFTKDIPFTGGYEVRAVFASANELHANSPVRIAGVEVGKVQSIEAGPGHTTVVTMLIHDNGRPLHRDATMKIRPRIFLEGNFFVDVRPGTDRAAELEDGGTIPLGQTAIPVQFDEVLASLNQSSRTRLRDLVREYATALDGGGAQALHDSFAAAPGAFGGAAVVAESVRGPRPHDLSAFIDAAGATAAAIAARDRELSELVTSFDGTVRALAAEQAGVAASVRGLAGVMRVAGPALGELNAAFPSLRAFTADVRPALRQAPATLDLANPLLLQLYGLLGPSELPPLIAGLRPAVRTLTRLEPKLVTLFDLVRPVTECVRRQALPVLTTPLEDGALSTGQPPWAELLHGMVGLASASQNFDGNGFAVRYQGGYGDDLISTGALPGTGQLFGLSSEPLIGSRPARPVADPPFRPDVPCASQGLVKLNAAVRAAPAARRGRAAPISPAALR
ncbi:MAG: MlaD family protein, partial [Solirubrobacteraceae bacterium]